MSILFVHNFIKFGPGAIGLNAAPSCWLTISAGN